MSMHLLTFTPACHFLLDMYSWCKYIFIFILQFFLWKVKNKWCHWFNLTPGLKQKFVIHMSSTYTQEYNRSVKYQRFWFWVHKLESQWEAHVGGLQVLYNTCDPLHTWSISNFCLWFDNQQKIHVPTSYCIIVTQAIFVEKILSTRFKSSLDR
jgi:hypothetical protein